METTHRLVVGDARSLELAADSVELVVTSPPYPMVEMWDEPFARLAPAVETALDEGDGDRAFELMHAELDRVWDELARVLVDGGIACVVVGDATRRLDDRFRVYPNHARVLSALVERGFDPLPGVLWRKPTNSAAKFMGSGMLPPSAYVTLEHEHVLVVRNGPERRSFEPGADRRYRAAYFWEERNRWFSDVWTDVAGELQPLDRDGLRERSAAFPLEIPYRLIGMYSVYGDTVLDPFLGTGTTSLAAMVAGRASVGYEIEAAFADLFDERVAEAPALSRRIARRRLAAHREYVADAEGLSHEAEHYDFPVTTRQERRIRLHAVERVTETDEGYRAVHDPVDG